MKDLLAELIMILTIVLLFVLFLFGLNKAAVAHDNRLWNDGHCNNCGGAWEYDQAVGHRSSTSYIYVCRKCGKRIELYEVR